MSKSSFYDIAKSTLIELAEVGNVRAIATLIQEGINKDRYIKILAKMVKEDCVEDKDIIVRALVDDNERVDVAHKLMKFTDKPKDERIKLTSKERNELPSFKRQN